MSFEAPVLLLSLVLVPLAAAGYWAAQRRPSRYAVSFPNLGVLASVAGERVRWRRHVTAVLALLALTALCVALARPTVTLAVPSERATVILVVDVSGSMRATDVRPSRLAAARQAIRGFLERVPREIRLALIAFSDDAQVVVAPTADREQLAEGVGLLAPGLGTAIGDALARAVELAQTATAEDGSAIAAPTRDASGNALASVLFLSDGSQTRGILTPGQAADRARAAGIPVYTIALGTEAGTILVGPRGQQQLVPVPPDRETLAAIAESTGGEAYDAETATALEQVYAGLGSRVGREDEPREVTVAFVAAGALLLAGAAAAAALGAPRLP